MAGLLLFLSGCKKDEDNFTKLNEKNTSIRSFGDFNPLSIQITTYCNNYLNPALGETGGPLDFISGSFGVQLKTTAGPSWDQIRQNAINGLNQLKIAIENGQITESRLDLMMPQNLSGNFTAWEPTINAIIATDLRYSG